MSRAAPSGGRSPRQREGSDAATARGAPAVATARGGGAAAAVVFGLHWETPWRR